MATKIIMTILPLSWQNIWVNRLVGLTFVISVLGLLIATKPPNKCNSLNYFHITGEFGNVDGLKKSSPIILAGVPVGVICKLTYLNATKRVKADLALQNNVAIADDSAMVILSEGFGGAKYIKISLGGSPINFQSGDSFQYSQDAILFDVLLNKIITLAEKNHKEKAKNE